MTIVINSKTSALPKEEKKCTVIILGKTYTIVSDETEEHILHAASLIDASMQGVIKKAHNADLQKAALLVALNYASKLLNLESTMQNFSKRELELINTINHEILVRL